MLKASSEVAMRIHVRVGTVVTVLLLATLAACEKNDKAGQTQTTSAEVAKAEREAAEAKRAAEEEAARLHTEVRRTLQADLDAADRKATYLKSKAAKMTGASKKNAEAA